MVCVLLQLFSLGPDLLCHFSNRVLPQDVVSGSRFRPSSQGTGSQRSHSPASASTESSRKTIATPDHSPVIRGIRFSITRYSSMLTIASRTSRQHNHRTMRLRNRTSVPRAYESAQPTSSLSCSHHEPRTT
ncbi:hypothetical protein LIA77_03890 [Sarocladium implicatum]|nr:hypothetical protein LIA77_03890 [Sarocladium implicatum]